MVYRQSQYVRVVGSHWGPVKPINVGGVPHFSWILPIRLVLLLGLAAIVLGMAARDVVADEVGLGVTPSYVEIAVPADGGLTPIVQDFLVSNEGDRPLIVRGAWISSSDEGTLDGGEVRITPSSIRLDPGERSTVHLEIPPYALDDERGLRTGHVVFNAASPDDVATAGSVSLAPRITVPVHILPAAVTASEALWSVLEVAPFLSREGDLEFHARVRNDGSVPIVVGGEVVLSDERGTAGSLEFVKSTSIYARHVSTLRTIGSPETWNPIDRLEFEWTLQSSNGSRRTDRGAFSGHPSLAIDVASVQTREDGYLDISLQVTNLGDIGFTPMAVLEILTESGEIARKSGRLTIDGIWPGESRMIDFLIGWNMLPGTYRLVASIAPAPGESHPHQQAMRSFSVGPSQSPNMALGSAPRMMPSSARRPL